MIWAPFLHLYQPPTQFPAVLKKIAEESYVPLVSFLERNPRSKATININASLTEQLAKLGYEDVLSGLRRLAEKGQVELTGSAAYHPLLSRIPFSEISRQVRLNEEINREYFGGVYKPRGFFPPEMAYSKKVGEAVAELGYEWILAEEFCSSHHPPRFDRIYRLDKLNLSVIFRQRELSLAIAFNRINSAEEFAALAAKELKEGDFILAALDGETFGHHHKDGFEILEGIYSRFESATISELAGRYPKGEENDPLESTWAASYEDCKKGLIYPRWDNPGSPLHTKQWELYRLALTVVTDYVHQIPTKMLDGKTRRAHLTADQRKWLKARELLDRGLHSDQFWWASHNPHWHPAMVERGADLLLKAVLATPETSEMEIRRAKELYQEITTEGVKRYGTEPIIG
ncbi:MAG: hypothetical protein WD940_01455 [Patescibacteria group bacterium]